MSKVIPKGLQEVLDSPRLTVAQKIESINMHTKDVWHLDPKSPWLEKAPLSRYQAKQLIKEFESGEESNK